MIRKWFFRINSRSWNLIAKDLAHRGKIDFALLVDGLLAEREQGITIDVAIDISRQIEENLSWQIPQVMSNIHYYVTGASTADAAANPNRRPKRFADTNETS